MSDSQIDEQRANTATCLAMLISLATVVGCLALKFSPLKSGLTLVVVGLVVQGLSNLLALMLMRPLANGNRLARFTIAVIRPVVPYAIGTYVAGVILLAIGGGIALLRLIF